VANKRPRYLEVAERARRVAALWLERKTLNEIRLQLARENSKWKISLTQVWKDLQLVRREWLREAKASYGRWVSEEIALTLELEREAREAFRRSGKTVKEKKTKQGRAVVTVTETVIADPDHAFLAEARECQKARRELRGLIFDPGDDEKPAESSSAAPESPAGPVREEDELARYRDAFCALAQSEDAEADAVLPPPGTSQPVGPAQADPPPGPVPAP
jgi:hypothetical protein